MGVPAVVALGGNKGVTVIKEKKQDKKDSVFGELSTVSRSVLIRLSGYIFHDFALASSRAAAKSSPSRSRESYRRRTELRIRITELSSALEEVSSPQAARIQFAIDPISS